jgi:hypothetical protein
VTDVFALIDAEGIGAAGFPLRTAQFLFNGTSDCGNLFSVALRRSAKALFVPFSCKGLFSSGSSRRLPIWRELEGAPAIKKPPVWDCVKKNLQIQSGRSAKKIFRTVKSL